MADTVVRCGTSFRSFDAIGPCGYIVYAHFYDTLIDLYETNAKLLEQTHHHWLYMNDQCWKPLQKTHRFYVAYPSLGKQRDGYSDNAKAHVTYRFQPLLTES
jgi:hypothetical protein